MNKLTPEQEKRFLKLTSQAIGKHVKLDKDGGSHFKAGAMWGIMEEVKQHLADELSRQRKEIIEKLEALLGVNYLEKDRNKFNEEWSYNEGIDQAIKTINNYEK